MKTVSPKFLKGRRNGRAAWTGFVANGWLFNLCQDARFLRRLSSRHRACTGLADIEKASKPKDGRHLAETRAKGAARAASISFSYGLSFPPWFEVPEWEQIPNRDKLQ